MIHMDFYKRQFAILVVVAVLFAVENTKNNIKVNSIVVQYFHFLNVMFFGIKICINRIETR